MLPQTMSVKNNATPNMNKDISTSSNCGMSSKINETSTILDITKDDNFAPVQNWDDCIDRFSTNHPLGRLVEESSAKTKRKNCDLKESITDICSNLKKQRLRFVVTVEDGDRSGPFSGTSLFVNSNFANTGNIQCFVMPSNPRTKTLLDTIGFMEIKFSFINDLPDEGLLPNLPSLLHNNISHMQQHISQSPVNDTTDTAPTPCSKAIASTDPSKENECTEISPDAGDLKTLFSKKINGWSTGGLVSGGANLTVCNKLTNLCSFVYAFEVNVIIDGLVYPPLKDWTPQLRTSLKFSDFVNFRFALLQYCMIKKVYKDADISNVTTPL